MKKMLHGGQIDERTQEKNFRNFSDGCSWNKGYNYGSFSLITRHSQYLKIFLKDYFRQE
eukprot:UN27714